MKTACSWIRPSSVANRSSTLGTEPPVRASTARFYIVTLQRLCRDENLGKHAYGSRKIAIAAISSMSRRSRLRNPPSQRAQHLLRGAAAARDRAVHGAGAALGLYRFPGKEERAAKRPRQRRRRAGPTDCHVAVRAAGEGIVLPIMRPEAFNERSQPLPRHPQLPRQRRHGTRLELVQRQLR